MIAGRPAPACRVEAHRPVCEDAAAGVEWRVCIGGRCTSGEVCAVGDRGSEGAELGAGELAALTSRGESRVLAEGEPLILEGEMSDTVYVVVDGELVATVASADGELEVGRIGTGGLIGEVAALSSAPRTASVRAAGPATVVGLAPDAFAEWLDTQPDVAAAVLARARDRLRAVQVGQIAGELFGEAAAQLVPHVLAVAIFVDLPAGEVLFHQGDEADAAYFVLSGRLQVTATTPAGDETHLRDIGRADVVGELAVVQRSTRSATVRALRDTTLARISMPDFESLLTSHPPLLLAVVRRIVTRLTKPVDEHRARSVALVVTAPVDPAEVIGPMEAELVRHGSSMRLDAERVDSLLGRSGVSCSPRGGLDDARLAQYLYELETAHDHLLFVCDRDVSEWTRRALQRADCLVVVSSPDPDEREVHRIREFVGACSTTRVDRWLAILDEPGRTDPTPGSSSPVRADFDEVHHVRRGRTADFERLARLAIGEGYGLVLGGGGARGFAHLGVLHAMEELGIPVDRVGGASMGAIFAATVALDLPATDLLELCASRLKRLTDYTVPVVALLKAKRITSTLEQVIGRRDAEDLWLPFWCVSTNLTRSRLEVHRTGDLIAVVRASIAIPGVLPPVPWGDDLLIDGGVLNNVPADVMRADPSIKTVIAVDPAPVHGPGTSENYGMYLSGWQAIRSRLRRRGADSQFPGMASVLVRSIITSSESKRAQVQTDGTVDLYIAVDNPDVGLLEFDKVRPVFDRGYQTGRPLLEEWFTAHRAARAAHSG